MIQVEQIISADVRRKENFENVRAKSLASRRSFSGFVHSANPFSRELGSLFLSVIRVLSRLVSLSLSICVK